MPERTYRWRGVNPRGEAHCGVVSLDPADLPGLVQRRFSDGWRSLLIAEGPGPAPPGQHEEAAAAIDHHPGSGQRRWWAESSA